MGTTRRALIFLISECLWGTSCTSSIILCTDHSTSFENGTTIPAMLGKPVSVVFCVQCEPGLTISKYIRIKHPNHKTGPSYYTNNGAMGIPIIVNITSSKNKATINISIKAVQKGDFTDQFSVTINTQKDLSDKSVFVFQLIAAGISDPTPSDASPILTTQPEMPATTLTRTRPASSSTKLSTVPSLASTASTSTISPTQRITECWPHDSAQCPENWYKVDTDTCLMVIRTDNTTTSSFECTKHDLKQVNNRNITKLRSCLTKILGEAKGASTNYIVRVNKAYYLNVQNGQDETATETYSVVCVNRTFEPPTVSLFSLQIYTKTGWKFVDNGTDNVIVQTASADVILTCHAEGKPKPRVIITDESLKQFTSGTSVRLDVCSRAKVFNCTANNSIGSSQAHRRILLLRPLKVTHFTATEKKRQEIRSGDTVELRCAVDGCPDNITITRNPHPIAKMANYASILVHEIQRVNCSHMGTYTCLAKSRTDQDGQKTAILEVPGCPVSACRDEDISRVISPTLGENVTFSLCLMSSEKLKYSANNETKIIVNWTKIPKTRFYWTVNVTMYSIQVKDYRTHTVRITNTIGSLDVHFTLKNEDSTHTLVGQKAQQHETDSNVLLIALPVVGVIILVFIIVIGIVWYRVKGRLTSRRRSEEIIDRGSGNDDSGEVLYANHSVTSVGRMHEQPEVEQQQEAGRLQCQEDCTATTVLHDKESGRFTTEEGLVYITVANANKSVKRSQRGKHASKRGDEERVEYIKLDFEKTGKLLVADEEETKADE